MRARVGLWIDHRKALVVALTDQGQETCLMFSNVERQLRRSGDSPRRGRYESQKVPTDRSRQRTFTEHMNIFYEAVIACLRDAEYILVFGPGEAKGELQKRLEKSRLRGRIAGFETADSMTDRQVVATVRQYFGEPAGRPVQPEARRRRLPAAGRGHPRGRAA